jgi:Fe-S-cluster containining protein
MSIFSGLMRRFDEADRIERLEASFTTAKKAGADHCLQCGFCCHRRPCVPTPDELPAIATFLGLTVETMLKTYFCVDEYKGVLHVKPAGANQRDYLGEYLPAECTFNEGACIFLDDDNKCVIHDVKPASARNQECWHENKEFIDARESWKGGDVARVLPGFKMPEDDDE